MACQPSSTFLLVASSTSNAGTICPAGMASTLSEPCVSLSSRSPKILKCSCSVLLAGQVDCILIVFGAGACACAPKANASNETTAMRFMVSSLLSVNTARTLPISKLLHPRPQLELPGPRAAVLAVHIQVTLRDFVRQQHAVLAALAGTGVVARLDAAVDDEMRDVNVLRR